MGAAQQVLNRLHGSQLSQSTLRATPYRTAWLLVKHAKVFCWWGDFVKAANVIYRTPANTVSTRFSPAARFRWDYRAAGVLWFNSAKT
jgi:hypothetical protein